MSGLVHPLHRVCVSLTLPPDPEMRFLVRHSWEQASVTAKQKISPKNPSNLGVDHAKWKSIILSFQANWEGFQFSQGSKELKVSKALLELLHKQ